MHQHKLMIKHMPNTHHQLDKNLKHMIKHYLIIHMLKY